MFVANALDTPTSSVDRLHVDDAVVTELDYYADAPAVLRTSNAALTFAKRLRITPGHQ